MQSITRIENKGRTGEDIANECCRSLCRGGEPIHQADGPVREMFHTRCHAARHATNAQHNGLFLLRLLAGNCLYFYVKFFIRLTNL